MVTCDDCRELRTELCQLKRFVEKYFTIVIERFDNQDKSLQQIVDSFSVLSLYKLDQNKHDSLLNSARNNSTKSAELRTIQSQIVDSIKRYHRSGSASSLPNGCEPSLPKKAALLLDEFGQNKPSHLPLSPADSSSSMFGKSSRRKGSKPSRVSMNGNHSAGSASSAGSGTKQHSASSSTDNPGSHTVTSSSNPGSIVNGGTESPFVDEPEESGGIMANGNSGVESPASDAPGWMNGCTELNGQHGLDEHHGGSRQSPIRGEMKQKSSTDVNGTESMRSASSLGHPASSALASLLSNMESNSGTVGSTNSMTNRIATINSMNNSVSSEATLSAAIASLTSQSTTFSSSTTLVSALSKLRASGLLNTNSHSGNLFKNGNTEFDASMNLAASTFSRDNNNDNELRSISAFSEHNNSSDNLSSLAVNAALQNRLGLLDQLNLRQQQQPGSTNNNNNLYSNASSTFAPNNSPSSTRKFNSDFAAKLNGSINSVVKAETEDDWNLSGVSGDGMDDTSWLSGVTIPNANMDMEELTHISGTTVPTGGSTMRRADGCKQQQADLLSFANNKAKTTTHLATSDSLTESELSAKLPKAVSNIFNELKESFVAAQAAGDAGVATTGSRIGGGSDSLVDTRLSRLAPPPAPNVNALDLQCSRNSMDVDLHGVSPSTNNNTCSGPNNRFGDDLNTNTQPQQQQHSNSVSPGDVSFDDSFIAQQYFSSPPPGRQSGGDQGQPDPARTLVPVENFKSNMNMGRYASGGGPILNNSAGKDFNASISAMLTNFPSADGCSNNNADGYSTQEQSQFSSIANSLLQEYYQQTASSSFNIATGGTDAFGGALAAAYPGLDFDMKYNSATLLPGSTKIGGTLSGTGVKMEKERCPICNRLSTLRNMKRHIDMVHGQPSVVACPYCTKTFKWKDTLRRHVKSFHPANAPDLDIKSERGGLGPQVQQNVHGLLSPQQNGHSVSVSPAQQNVHSVLPQQNPYSISPGGVGASYS